MTVQHTVTLLHASPLHLASHGARTCWDSHDKSDTKDMNVCIDCEYQTSLDDDIMECPKCGSSFFQQEIVCGEKDMELIDRIGNKFRHASILEHLNYTFYIEGISRACLQELSRHRHTSPSVKSSRYTLKELKEDYFTIPSSYEDDKYWDTIKKYIVLTGNLEVDIFSCRALKNLASLIEFGASNDLAKYAMPEAYKVTEQLTINARSLQNFLLLRSDKSALWEIRQLATSLYEALPTDHQHLFTHCMKDTHE